MENEVQNEKNGVQEGFNALMKDKKKFGLFIMFALSTLVSLFFLFKMSLSGLTLIYIIAMIVGGAGLTFYSYSINKKNTTVLFFSLLILIIGFILRVIQSSMSGNIEYILRYLLFFVASLMIFYNIYKNEKNNKNGLIKLLLLLGAADAIYLFFSLGNISFLGYVWRLFLVSEALLSIALAFTSFDFDALKDLNKTYKDILNKIPNCFVLIIVVCIIAAVLYVFNLDDSSVNNSYDPINGDNNSNSGSIIENRNEEDEEEEEEKYIETKNVTKDKSTIVKTTYGDDEYEIEISLDSMYTTDKVVPPNPTQSYYHYYDASEGKTYLVVVANVKNIGSTTINSDYLFTNFLGDYCSPKAVFDGKYEYTSGTVVGLDKDNNGKYDLDSYYYIDALETVQIYTIYEIADEVADKSAVVNMCFSEVSLNIINNTST